MAIMKKWPHPRRTGDGAWKPNLVQIVVSEIQNILELEALASEDELLRDPVTHTALWYYLLEALGPIDPQALPDTRAAVMSVIDKIVDGLRRRLSSDTDLLNLTDRALIGELKDLGWTKEAWPKGKYLLDGAVSLARTKGRVVNSDVLFRLNSFSSTERFSRANITTGTVFRHTLSDRYFIAASPACDLVARVPSPDQWWSNSIHPLTPLVAVMLNSASSDQALNEATQGNHIFLEIGKDKKAFKAVAGPGHHPPFEFLILKNEGRVREKDGRTVFDAKRLLRKQTEAVEIKEASKSDSEWVDGEFEVVAQLRSVYATHILQLTGQHLSRIGLDFTSTPRTNG